MALVAEDGTMAAAGNSNLTIYEWTERIIIALHDHQPRFQRPLTHHELQVLTGLDAVQASRGCWQGRLQGLLLFQHGQEHEGYTLTPLGFAMVRRLKEGHKPLYTGAPGLDPVQPV